jgi:hypothetical protein
VPTLAAVFVAELITIRCFRMSAPKAGNGFVAPEICFVVEARRHNRAKNSMISIK